MDPKFKLMGKNKFNIIFLLNLKENDIAKIEQILSKPKTS